MKLSSICLLAAHCCCNIIVCNRAIVLLHYCFGTFPLLYTKRPNAGVLVHYIICTLSYSFGETADSMFLTTYKRSSVAGSRIHCGVGIAIIFSIAVVIFVHAFILCNRSQCANAVILPSIKLAFITRTIQIHQFPTAMETIQIIHITTIIIINTTGIIKCPNVGKSRSHPGPLHRLSPRVLTDKFTSSDFIFHNNALARQPIEHSRTIIASYCCYDKWSFVNLARGGTCSYPLYRSAGERMYRAKKVAAVR
mmetsp:Transcript_25416/g.39353  ORF Transcript_25416/g.39353 Transcript_25416/m.39353 type:complete len:251 (+) Transcript_25416:2016-2768(+)